MANLTEHGNLSTKLSETFSASPAWTLEVFSALNILLSITAFMGNALILAALHRVSCIYPPTKLFFRCLAVTDLCVGLVLQPLYTIYIRFPITGINVNHFFYVEQVYRTLGWILCGVSVLTLTAISVDRLLALLLRLRYRHFVTLRRVRVVIICSWLLTVSYALSRKWREDVTFKLASVVLTLSLVISIFCYTKIHLKLRHYQAQVQNSVLQIQHRQQNGKVIPLNIARYKKTVSSIMWVQLALVACYIPWVIVVVLYVNGIENQVVWNATGTLLYFNSSLNPILYCWKIREVKRAVEVTVNQVICFKPK